MHVGTDTELTAPTGELRTLLLSTPETLTPKAKQISEAVTAVATSPEMKMLRVASYFGQGYQYSLEMETPEGQEPLNYFLEAKAASHCEFFASGAVMLLRLAGIPCRYVTGFVAAEENTVGGYWLARNRDAHAWVEAYDDEAQLWRIVEATPGSGVPKPQPASTSAELWDSLKQRFREFVATLRALSWRRAVLIVAAVAGATAALAAGAVALWRILERRRRRPRLSPHLRALHRELAQHDRALRKKGLTRKSGETLHQFAGRVEREIPDMLETAGWYRDYALRRYGS